LNADKGISTNILAERLKRLLDSEIENALPHPTNKIRKLYYLTNKGKYLLPITLEMVFWGGAHLEALKPARAKINEAKKMCWLT
jgi:DNA-binding HxlR family transcriptional regulator